MDHIAQALPFVIPRAFIMHIAKAHPRMAVQALAMPRNPGQALAPLRRVIWGPKLGPFPPPAHVMDPSSYGPRGHPQAVLRLELGYQRRTTPPRPAPAIGTW